VTSRAVGITLNNIALNAKLMDLDPLSIARARAPVFLITVLIVGID
jgi:hypothetical protein